MPLSLGTDQAGAVGINVFTEPLLQTHAELTHACLGISSLALFLAPPFPAFLPSMVLGEEVPECYKQGGSPGSLWPN